MARPLTVRGVRQILSRAGVDSSALAIEARTVTQRDAWNGGPWTTSQEIVVTAPRDVRRPADEVLWGAGLTCAPYPDHSVWSRC